MEETHGTQALFEYTIAHVMKNRVLPPWILLAGVRRFNVVRNRIC